MTLKYCHTISIVSVIFGVKLVSTDDRVIGDIVLESDLLQ